MEEAERIQAQVEPDQSEQLRRTRVWRLDQFTGLGFDSARAALMADDGGVDLAQARRLIALGARSRPPRASSSSLANRSAAPADRRAPTGGGEPSRADLAF